ncbi:MAG: sulfite oxidase [Thermomicrobiales bacterium]
MVSQIDHSMEDTSAAYAKAAETATKTPSPLVPTFPSMFTAANPGDFAEDLRSLGKDPRIVPVGGFNMGTPMELMEGLNTPTSRFFVRTNGPTMTLDDPANYVLQVVGHVDKPLKLTLNDLKGMRQRTYSAFLQCAGDGRNAFHPRVDGNQWGNNAISNAEWTGVPLRDILAEAGVKDGAVDAVSQGGDFDEMQRGLPIDTAMNANTIIALKMNGEDLPAPHGGPARLLVPGWAGIASTKWLLGLTLLDRPFQGDYNVKSYVIIDEMGQVVRLVREIPVKSIVTSPGAGATIAAGGVAVAGYAWSGTGAITRVEISTDSGVTWADAKLTEEDGSLAWVRFEYDWKATAGGHTLLSRATDARGVSQPFSPAWNLKGYLNSAIQAVPVDVTG